MRLSYQKLINSDILRNTFILISGTALAQLIPILLQPLLRRSFTPETFGAYSVYLSLLGILIVICSLRYELAIILPEKDDEALGVFFLSVTLNFLFSLILFIIILLFRSPILLLLNLPEKFQIYLLLTPAGIFLLGFYQSINYWLIRKKGFMALSLNKFLRRGTEGVSQVSFIFSRISNGLIFGDIIGHLANVTSGIIQGIKTGLTFRLLNPGKMLHALKRYSSYPKYNLLPAFMEACSFLLPALMINKLFSTDSTGYFDLCKLLLSVPLALVATSLSNVLLQRISEKSRMHLSIKNDLQNVLVFVLLIAVAEIATIMIFGEGLFRLFFGPGWDISGRISKILVWSFAFNFLISSFSSIFISLSKIKLLSAWQVFYLCAILLLLFFNKLGFESFLKVYVTIEIICSSIVSVLMLLIISRYERELSVGPTVFQE
ncbi:MAG TPA: oligosaccharide flippase family protein [Bacteroidales bacterium]|nr:oligosaccharide flippase family protein [Bacteroidales bacterium]